MKTKLTLSVDKDLVDIARNQAKRDRTSVSALFSKFITDRKIQSEREATASVKSMIGSLKGYAIDDSKAAIRSQYADKHIN